MTQLARDLEEGARHGRADLRDQLVEGVGFLVEQRATMRSSLVLT